MSAQNWDWHQQEFPSPLLLALHSAILAISLVAPVTALADLAPPTEEIAGALARLAADSYAERERASHALWQHGEAAEPYLERALGDQDIEVRARARRVLQLLRFGLNADASPAHWRFIADFHSSAPQHKATILFEMLQKGEASLALRLLDGSGSARAAILTQLESELGRMLPSLIIDGEMEEATRLVDLMASSGRRLRYAAWFHLLTGSIDDAAARLAALTAPDANARKRHYYLATARGDTDTASLLARALAMSEEERSFGLGDITPTQFAKRSAEASSDQIELLGFLAAHARLTGDQQSFDNQMKGLERVARISRKERPFCLEAMIINGDIKAAIKSSTSAIEPFRIHAQQWNINAALQSLGISGKAPPFSPWIENLCRQIKTTARLKTRQELLAYPYALAELCIQTGEQTEAERICRLTADALFAADPLGFHQAIRYETELGLDALAMEHAVRAMESGTPEISVFLGLYGKSNQHARNWFDYLRKLDSDRNVPPGDRLQQLALLLSPEETDDASTALVTTLLENAFAAKNPLRGVRKATWPVTLAYTASLHGVPVPDGFSIAPVAPQKPVLEIVDAPRLPMATRVLGRPEFVLSPFGEGWIVDVTGQLPGAESVCPYSRKKFLIPPRLEDTAALRPRNDDNIQTLRATGTAHLDAKRYEQAVNAYEQALTASAHEAAPELLYQLGEALELAGNESEGRRRKLQARLLAPLTADRLGFIEFLWERGATEIVAEECRFLYLGDQARIATADGRMFEIVARFLAKTDPLRAADLWEMKLLTSLRKQKGSTLTNTLESRFLIHHTRATGYQQLGDFPASLAELKIAATVLPADARLAKSLVPLMKNDTVQKEASALFQTIANAARSSSQQFPNSALLRENLEHITAAAPADNPK
ncbi:MAG: tetratricopeptide (TPR) repeat protein [Verrucomicrobiales bacterium]|jgi:tetratricopeptide (TPR) repeat protein